MSDNLFVTNIEVRNLRNLTGFNIHLNSDSKKHLIITGKNGSGKSTLLTAINSYLELIPTKRYKHYIDLVEIIERKRSNIHNNGLLIDSDEQASLQKSINNRDKMSCLDLELNRRVRDSDSHETLFAYFDSKRSIDHNLPNGISKVSYKDSYKPSEKINSQFIQYIVNLKAERSFARDDGDKNAVKEIDAWFEKFEKSLANILEEPGLELVFDRKEFNFSVKMPDRETFKLSEMSDGHTAILSVLSELIMRMEFLGSKSYSLSGVVLIDEIETHLHVGLQKKILPFLTSFFPNVQFIITTHSPFVLSSIKDSVICDLQRNIVTSDLSGYSYDALIESYFGSNNYSLELIEMVNTYEKYIHENKYDTPEAKKIYSYLDSLPKYLNEGKELELKIKQLEIEIEDKEFKKSKKKYKGE